MAFLNIACGTRRRLGALLPAFVRIAVVVISIASAGAAMALDIRNDMGGSVAQRIHNIENLRAVGTPVRILGTCVSACTLYLGLPNACVSPLASLGFHGPSTRLKGLPLSHDAFERVSRQMAAYYPAQMRKWFMEEGRLRTESYFVISGAQAIAMGARACG